jgi:alpha-D-xyloside xylohydrolase
MIKLTPYSDDNYAGKFLAGKTVFPDDTRIFQRPDCTYDYVTALGQASLDETAFKVDAFLRSGAAASLALIPVMPGVLRIQFGRAGAAFEETSPMLEAFPAEHPALEYSESADAFICHYSGYRLELDKTPFCLRVISPKGETIFESEWEKIVDMYTTPALGLRRRAKEPLPNTSPAAGKAAFLSWRTRAADRYFGLGEKFTRFEKSGTRATIWEADTCGSNTSDMSYKAVPVVFSTAGWALMLHTAFRSSWELGSFSYASGGLLAEDERLDLFLILAPTLKEQVMAYTGLTGRPQMPPRWAFGLWMSRAAYQNRAQLLEVAERLRAEEIPCDVFNIDPTWMERGYYNEIGVEVCNFNWNARDWGQPEALFSEFAEKGFGLCLWINPYLSTDSPAYAEAREKGYLVKSLSGGISGLEFGLKAGIIDFTNPEAKAWWQAKLIDLLHQGAAVFKVDFGDRVPADALFFNGKSGREMHNLYVHLYAQAVYEAVEQVSGTGMVWRRPGYIGSQRYPASWAGDTQVTWEGMAGALRGGLSAAFTGEAFWSHDIGGFVGQQPGEELYIRWAQFGLLSPLARFHGTTPREPWHYGPRALEVARHYTRLRYSLLPYLLACARESTQSGLPLLRPMVLEYPAEPRIDAIDDQYMLGPDLLVAPVFQPGARARVIYLPKGQWWAFERTGRRTALNGPGFHEVEAPLERMPLFARCGAVIPRYQQPPQHLKGPAPKEWLLEIYPGDSRRSLAIQEPGFTLEVDYRCENGSGRLEISPAPVTIAVRLIERQPTFLRAIKTSGAAAAAALQPGDSGTSFSVDASQGVIVEFRS